jgi:hypothetical protein
VVFIIENVQQSKKAKQDKKAMKAKNAKRVVLASFANDINQKSCRVQFCAMSV